MRLDHKLFFHMDAETLREGGRSNYRLQDVQLSELDNLVIGQLKLLDYPIIRLPDSVL